jgi:amidase
MERAGLITLGRTASPEWGSLPTTEPLALGPTRNPYDLGRSPGGSSGGSAAAVAAGMVPLAHGSDGGGSIRVPAACCGLVGLKPSQGRITVGPDRDEAGLSVEMALTRTVRDAAAFLDAVAGRGVGDALSAPAPASSYAEVIRAAPGRWRIGLMESAPNGVAVDPECLRAVRDAARLLEGLGHHVEYAAPAALTEADLGQSFGVLWATNMALHARRTAQLLGRELRPDDVEDVNWALAQRGQRINAIDYASALARISALRRAIHHWWEVDGWDLLLTPTMAEPAAPIGTFANDAESPLAPMARAARYVPFTSAFNLTQQPAISLPLHASDDGLPIGVQLVAAYGREDLLLRVGAQLEQASPWASRHPAGRHT